MCGVCAVSIRAVYRLRRTHRIIPSLVISMMTGSRTLTFAQRLHITIVITRTRSVIDQNIRVHVFERSFADFVTSLAAARFQEFALFRQDANLRLYVLEAAPQLFQSAFFTMLLQFTVRPQLLVFS